MAEETRSDRVSNGKSCPGVREAKVWETNPLAPLAADQAVAEFLAAVPWNSNSTVLEVGCGSGLCTELIARKVGAVLGMDSSKGLIKRFEAKAAGLKLQNKMAAVRMELKDPKQLQDYLPDERGFDFAFSHRALHHLRDFGAALKVLVRVLRPGGWLFVTDVESDGNTPLVKDGEKETGLRNGLREAELEAGLQAAGLVDISVDRCFRLSGKNGKEHDENAWYLKGLGRKPRSSSLQV